MSEFTALCTNPKAPLLAGLGWVVGVTALGSALGAGSVLPDAAMGAGVFNRFKYVPALRGFVLMSSGTSNVYFMRTA